MPLGPEIGAGGGRPGAGGGDQRVAGEDAARPGAGSGKTPVGHIAAFSGTSQG